MLTDIPDGVVCFIDATIFYYHFVNTPPLSDDLLDHLTEHKQVAAVAQALRLTIEPLTLDLLTRGADLSPRQRLLTNDALLMAVMEKLGVSYLATNDDDFDSIAGLTVCKPARS